MTQFRNFGYPVITFEQIKLSASNLVPGTQIVRMHQRTTSMHRVTLHNVKISGRPYHFRTNQAIPFKFGIEIEVGAFQLKEHKLTPFFRLSGRGRGHVSQF